MGADQAVGVIDNAMQRSRLTEHRLFRRLRHEGRSAARVRRTGRRLRAMCTGSMNSGGDVSKLADWVDARLFDDDVAATRRAEESNPCCAAWR